MEGIYASRAYPARITTFARAPFAARKGRGWCWFSGSAWKGCVGGLAGWPRSAPGIPRSLRSLAPLSLRERGAADCPAPLDSRIRGNDGGLT